jgi:hypothetical protein
MLANPLTPSSAPLGSTELAQPRPGPPAFPHGQAAPLPSPLHSAGTSASLTSWMPLSEPNPTLANSRITIVPSTTVARCCAYVTPSSCAPGHGPPTSWAGSAEPASDTCVRNASLSGAHAYVSTV